MQLRFTGFAISLLFLASCSTHQIMRGSIAMKVGARDAHVCFGKDEVSAGERVLLFANRCSSDGKAAWCEKIFVGEGTITKLLDRHYSVVRVDSGVQFSEGMVVERKR